MPYIRKGKTVYKRVGKNKLQKVGSSKSVAAAKRHQKLLRAIEHGWKPGT